MGILSDVVNNERFDMQESLDYIDEYEKSFLFDSSIHTARAVTYFLGEDFKNAEKHIRIAIKYMPNNPETNLYMANILIANGKYSEAIKAGIRGLLFYRQLKIKENLNEFCEQVEDIIDYCSKRITDIDEIKELKKFISISQTNCCFFPMRFDDGKWVMNVCDYIYKDSKKQYNDYIGFNSDVYMPSMSEHKMNINKQINYGTEYAFIPTESFKSLNTKEFVIDNGEYIVPIANTEIGQSIKFTTDKQVYETLKSQVEGVFNYYRIDEKVKLTSEKDFIVGRPIKLGINKKKKKLILNIFVDALSQKYLSDTEYVSMPYTKKFFSEGTIFKNCYCTGEWTIPSMGGIFTGLYTSNHHIVHECSAYRYPEDTETYSEIFNKNGYFTANITGCTSISPYEGGMRGFDRTLFKHSLGYYDATLISDAIDHIEAFKDTNQFVLLSLYDVHRSIEDIEDRPVYFNIVQQTSTDFITSLSKLKPGTVSVRQRYDESAIRKYEIAIKDIDRRLKVIYDYVSQNYSEDEYIINLFSDHGISLLDKDEFLLKPGHTNSVLMMRGLGIPKVECDEYINHMDLLPIVATLSNIEYDFSKHDCILPKIFGGNGREYTYTEAIYPTQTYKASVNNSKYYYKFETVSEIDVDELIDVSSYDHQLFDKKSGKEIFDENILNYFTNVVYEHIKRNIKY